jgi:hypothetical protein
LTFLKNTYRNEYLKVLGIEGKVEKNTK